MENLEIEKEILAEAKRGDLKSFEKILFTFEKRIFNYILAIVKHRQDAEDLTQEVFLKLYKNLKYIEPELNFRAWLYAIATNTVRDWFRKKGRQPELFIINEPDNNFETIDEDFSYYKLENTKDIRQALDSLKPAYRTVLSLFYWQGFGYEEIAQILNLPLNTVKTYIRRAKISFKEFLLGTNN